MLSPEWCSDLLWTVWLYRAGEKITVTPSSKELLFYPPEVEATITGGMFLLTHTHTHTIVYQTRINNIFSSVT